MPNLAQIYSDITRPKSEEQLAEEAKSRLKEPDAGRTQAVLNWKASTITKEKVNKYVKEIETLLDEAVLLSKTFPQHQNPHKIIANLNRIDQLKGIINDYV